MTFQVSGNPARSGLDDCIIGVKFSLTTLVMALTIRLTSGCLRQRLLPLSWPHVVLENNDAIVIIVVVVVVVVIVTLSVGCYNKGAI